jgi:nickel-dependent lactate racemase
MATFVKEGGKSRKIDILELQDLLKAFVKRHPVLNTASAKKVLLIPPDFTRFHSQAGEICGILYQLLSKKHDIDLLPALGTHRPHTEEENRIMFHGIPPDRILVHNWQTGLVRVGEISGKRLKEISGGKVDYSVKVEIDKIVAEGGYDAIISCGQIVPHEVAGMAGGNKNILVGTAGPDTINKSHFLGAVCNMEKIMGEIESPVRTLFNEAEDRFLKQLPISYILTVRAKDENGALVTRGIFCGDDRSCYLEAAKLSKEVNIFKTPALRKVVVWLDPSEFKSTWLGNKAIYRTRMAVADGGELVVIAPGLKEFGEAEVNEKFIRKYGYCGTEKVLKAVKEDAELRNALGAAAHLIHGSSEGRFRIIYAPGKLTRKDIESVHFEYAPLEDMMKRYDHEKLKDGFNVMPDGEEIYYISNPALGLWKAN